MSAISKGSFICSSPDIATRSIVVAWEISWKGGAWWAIFYEATESQTQLGTKRACEHAHTHTHTHTHDIWKYLDLGPEDKN